MLYSYVGIDLAWKSGAIVVLDQDLKIRTIEVPDFPQNIKWKNWNDFSNKLEVINHWKRAIEKLPRSNEILHIQFFIEVMGNNKLFNYLAGYLTGIIASLNKVNVKVDLIEPNHWNKHLTNLKQRDQIKEASLNFFKASETSWYAKFKDHPNLIDIADSYCIAYFGHIRKASYEIKKRHRQPTKNNRNQNTIKETKQRTIRQVKSI